MAQLPIGKARYRDTQLETFRFCQSLVQDKIDIQGEASITAWEISSVKQ